MRKNYLKRLMSYVMILAMLLSYIPVTAWAVDASTDIKAIEKPAGWIIVENYDDYYGDGWEDKLELPTAVTVTLADDSTVEAPVTWDTSVLDPRTPGYYYLPGTVTLPDGATNGQELGVQITIQVAEKKNLFANGDFESTNTYTPNGWNMPGLGVRYTTEFVKSGAKAGWARSTNKTDVRRNGYNQNGDDLPATVGARVAELGAGQYYFGIYGRKGDSEVTETFQAQFYYKYGTQTSNTRADGNKITLTTQYQASSGIVELPENVTSAQLQFNFYKTDTTVTFDEIGAYVDDAELFALKTALKVEPSAIDEVKTEILSRRVVINYADYVGEDWKAALGLPETVEVLTDTGATASVNVSWNYNTLDLTNYGKYTLIGTLDDSSFPNPKGLSVEQVIYVSKANNLIPNPSFESSLDGWHLRGINPTPNRVTTPVKDGKYAAMTGVISTTRTTDSVAYTSEMADAMGAAIAEWGAGQYYFSLWGQSASQTLIDGLKLQARLYYKTEDAQGTLSAAIAAQGNIVSVGNSEFAQSTGILSVPKNTVWARLDMYVSASSAEDLCATAWYLDKAELIALNVSIPKDQEPSDITEVVTEIPVRAVVEDYNKYVGDSWQSALGLPETVQVRTANGNVASVSVSWDYDALNITKVGKYTLTGSLDASTYPNPQNLTVTQIIYVREYKNLISNPSFESGLTGWYLRGMNPSPSVVNTVSKHGKYAAMTGSISTTRTQEAIVTTRDMTEDLGEAVALTGGGQYYYSGWMQSASSAAISGLELQAWLYYKTSDEDGSLSAAMSHRGEKVSLTNYEFSQSMGVLELPANTAWVRLDLYVSAQSAEDLCKAAYYADLGELVAINTIVEQYDGQMVQVESIIPDRQIIVNYPDYIGESYTTADLMLPETVDVLTSEGQTVNIGVKWNYSTLNLSKTGTYTLVGTLEEMKIANPDALTVKQTIHVVEYKNLLSNPDFESDDDWWSKDSLVSIASGISSPRKSGDFSLEMTVSRLDSYSRNWIQAFFNSNPATLGEKITKTGTGLYFFGGWFQGTQSSTDIEVQLRLLYRNLSKGDTVTTVKADNLTLSATSFSQAGALVEMPDDIYWSRMDLYIYGSVSQMRQSILYMDDFEVVPLNVEVPNLNDIISCEECANIYVHEGASVQDLKLPEELEVIIKNGQRFTLAVTWDTSAYDANLIGEQTITGALNLGSKYNNPKNFVPTVKVTVRAKGEDLRETIYISTSGSEDNDGLSPESPKKEITNLATYLRQGYNVKLKRGDVWYIPTGSISLKQLYGTEDAPLTISAYGSGDTMPVIGFMKKIADSEWTLVDAKRNIYAVDVSSFGQKNGESVHRCFVNDEAYFHLSRTNYVTLKDKEFCSYNNTLYVRMPEGESPKNVEITPFGSGTTRMYIEDVSYLTFEGLHFKGASSIYPVIRMDAPTKFVKFTNCHITHCWYYTILLESDDEQIHYKPEFSYLYMDTMLSEKQGAVSGYDSVYWNPHGNEGITMRDGVDGAWIHHCTMRQFSHAFVAIESTERGSDYTTTGVRNCIIEDNYLESGNALYSRAFNICGGYNLSMIQMCRDNTYRRNRCYDMTTSSHLYGENNLIYSNVFSYAHCSYDEDGNLFDGKGAQPWAFDTIPWDNHVSIGNVLVNNTFYDVSGAIAINDQAHTVYNNLYANNLIVNWTSDTSSYPGGAIYDNTIDMNYVMNNGVYSAKGMVDHFVVDTKIYSADDVNNAVAGYSGNIYADPQFLYADVSLSGKNVRQDFTLSGESSMRYAGLSLYSDVYANFPAWERLMAEYTDVNGVLYLAESPSIGAYSYSERIKGDVAEVGKLDDIVARPGAEFDQLNLPDAVPATNDQGIEVMLLADWSDANFDSSKPGTITVTAQLRNGPHTELNINGKVAVINVVIKDRLEMMGVNTVLKNLTVPYGTTLDGVLALLPQTLDVMEESGFREDLAVTWSCEDFDPYDPDSYTFKCVLPEDKITNAREFEVVVEVRVLHEIGRGMELLVNPDFVDGGSASPWKIGWGTGSFRITTDPQYLLDGEPSAAIITVARRYASLQQDVLGQMQLMGDGKYLFKVYMRAYDANEPIDSSFACLKIWGLKTYTIRCSTRTNIGTDWVEYSAIMSVTDIAQATEITFHTSTGKSLEDAEEGPRSYIISGCSLIYLGNTDAEVQATMDSIDLDWNMIKGENGLDMDNVTSDLELPVKIGAASTIKWTSSDESVISNDGKVTMGRVEKEVTLTATITYNGIETVKKFTVTVPRNPDLPTFSGAISGSQTVNVGDEFQVTISLAGEKASSFNAYRFTVSFNTSKLEYISCSDAASTVEVEGSKIIISGIGTERPVTDTITLTFKAKKSGVTEVKLVKVEMDLDANVTLESLPAMTVSEGAALIDVQKVEETDGTAAAENDNSGVIWIVIGLVAAALLCGGVLVIILIKKKKQDSST